MAWMSAANFFPAVLARAGSVTDLVQGGLEYSYYTYFLRRKSFDYAEGADVAQITRIRTSASCQMPCHGILKHRNFDFFLSREGYPKTLL